jgi:hypothetical protein
MDFSHGTASTSLQAHSLVCTDAFPSRPLAARLKAALPAPVGHELSSEAPTIPGLRVVDRGEWGVGEPSSRSEIGERLICLSLTSKRSVSMV